VRFFYYYCVTIFDTVLAYIEILDVEVEHGIALFGHWLVDFFYLMEVDIFML